MTRFRFNLQKLLQYRRSIEERLLCELSAIRAHQAREHSRLTNFKAAVSVCRQDMKGKLATGSTPDEIKDQFRYLHELSQRVVSQELVIRQLEERRQSKTAEVLEAAKDRKALEQLREQKRLEHAKEMAHEEQKLLDEVAATRTNRARAA